MAAMKLYLINLDRRPDRLAAMSIEVQIAGPDGTKTMTAKASEALGDPASIVLMARDQLAAEGVKFKAGDILSLGSFLPATKPAAGETVSVRYMIKEKPDVVSVRFQ